jgi:hypothetical protein
MRALWFTGKASSAKGNGSTGLEELRALEALCAREASRRCERDLRAHHGTVARRLDRGFAATALDCQDPEHRFTVQLAVYLGALGSR